MGSEQIVEFLVTEGKVKVDALCPAMSKIHDSTRCGSNHHTALTLSSMAGSKSIVRLLLDNGANVISRNPDFAESDPKQEHSDALLLAVINDQEECALLLLRRILQMNVTVLPGVTREVEKRRMQHLPEALRTRTGNGS